MLTYCGLLDDFSLRHKDIAIGSVPALNKQLIASALFGEPLLINDGYVLVHPALQQAILAPRESPLRSLVESGYLKILTRNDGHLELLAQEMADRRIASARKLIAQPWYIDTYQPELQQWSSLLRSEAREAFFDWPNIRTDEIFKSVATAAYKSLCAVEREYQTDFDRFRDNLDPRTARRTEWEIEADKLLDDGHISANAHRKLMLTASEAYHYSWGCALGLSGESIRVLTRLPEHLRELDLPLGQLTDMPKPPVKVYVPETGFAIDAIQNRWQLLTSMLTPGGELNHLKRSFLTHIERYNRSEIDFNETQNAANAYARALSRHFGNPKTVELEIGAAVLGISTASSFGGPVGIGIGIGLSVAAMAASYLGWTQLLWRMAAPDPKGWISSLQQVDPQSTVSSFQLSPAQVSTYVTGVAPFKG